MYSLYCLFYEVNGTMHMMGTNLSSYSAIVLFTALVKENKLQLLNIQLAAMTACDVIAVSVKNNFSLTYNTTIQYNTPSYPENAITLTRTEKVENANYLLVVSIFYSLTVMGEILL